MANASRNAVDCDDQALVASARGNRFLLAILIQLAAASTALGQWTASAATDSGQLSRATIGALAVDPWDPDKILIGADGLGIFRSTDGGRTLHSVDAANASLRSSFDFLEIDPDNPETAYAGGFYMGLFKTTNRGDRWAAAGFEGLGIRTLAIDPTQTDTLYLGYATRHWRGTVYKSTDAASTWEPARLSEAVYAILVDRLHPKTLYAGSDFDYGSYYPGGGGIFRSDDAGVSWSRLPTRFESVVGALAMDPTDSSRLYAGGDGLSISTDHGLTWSEVQSPYLKHHWVNAIVVDPRENGSIYVSTDKGVRQSVDRGVTWSMLGSGGPGILPIASLALSPDGRRLYAGTVSNGLFTYEVPTDPPAPVPCNTDTQTLCLLGGRFEVGAVASDYSRNETRAATPVAQGDRFGYFSLPDFTGDPTLPEIVVKMVDAAQTGRSFWFFYSGLTSLPYTLSVRDTVTGALQIYSSDGYCGGADTSAFPADAVSDLRSRDAVSVLVASGTELSLLNDGFRLTLTATNPRNGRITQGSAIPQNDRFGYFSLPEFTGDPNFPEVFVKIIDGTSLPGNTFWVFYTGLTNLPYTLTVTDTVTGTTQTYSNNGVTPFCGGADTGSFLGTLGAAEESQEKRIETVTNR